MKKKLAFTLAELLIALGIMGIVAAVTLPMLQQSKPNKNKIMAKKVYMTTAQIVEEMINDPDLYPEYNDGSSTRYDGFDNTATAGGCAAGAGKFKCLFIKYLNGGLSGSAYISDDGAKWTIGNTDTSGTTTIEVDVDSSNNTVTSGNNADTFTMAVAKDGKITINTAWAKNAIKMGQTNHLD